MKSSEFQGSFDILPWSQAEKRIARKAYNTALHRELEGVITEVKERVRRMDKPGHLWELEAFLTRRRKEIDRQYDFRYSVLPVVFANLIAAGRLSEQDLEGLREDKLAPIRCWAKL